MPRPSISIKDEDIIAFVRINPNCNCPEIARHFNINRKSAHKRIQKLQRKGILEFSNGFRKNAIRFSEKYR
ncbi:MAG: MarR family transcriptional regulator [Leptospiraceae bacterium]|nr:MarR family transcriptional regulator [Leptospiraceae bacterium]NUM42482.1 MarR family transcriptional regulator [Leptospiraceae bacterium]